ncbi:MAG: helix-turn-helix domain-containing protein [Acidithiobacillus caldus]|nr:helix-turn-helix domain-containing protein [Acidithiobacillus caldus]
MKQPLPVDIHDCGKLIEIKILVPWTALAENAWDHKLRPNKKIERTITKALTEAHRRHILNTYEKLQSISKTAKACGEYYFLTRQIIEQEASRRRRAQKTQLRQSARTLHAEGASIAEIAAILGRSRETIRRWIRSHPTGTDLAEQGQRQRLQLVSDRR